MRISPPPRPRANSRAHSVLQYSRVSKARTMYAVIKTGGKQYRVQPGDLLVVEKLAGDPGADVAFGEVLAVGEGAAVTLGAPLVAGASVTGTLIETRPRAKGKTFKK